MSGVFLGHDFVTVTLMTATVSASAGPADAKTVNALQDQYTLIPLSLWGKKDAVLPASRDVWQPFDPKTDPLAEWRTMTASIRAG